MKEYYQDDSVFSTEIQETGCHYFCFLWIIEQYLHKKFSVEERENILEKLRQVNIMSQESFVLYPDKFLEYLAPGKFKYYGIQKSYNRGWEPEDNIYYIIMYEWKEKGSKHFVVGHPDGTVYYDPQDDRSQTRKHGELINFRIIKGL